MSEHTNIPGVEGLREDIDVMSPGQWENESGPQEWFAIADAAGIKAYASTEVLADFIAYTAPKLVNSHAQLLAAAEAALAFCESFTDDEGRPVATITQLQAAIRAAKGKV